MKRRELSFDGVKISVDQWTSGYPKWTHLCIEGGEKKLEIGLYPADFILIADFLYSLKPQIELDK